MVPFESFASDLGALVNRHLGLGEETIVGWCLLVDRECQMLKVARIFFDRFLRVLVRCLVANLPASHCTLAGETADVLAEEIGDLARPLVGLIVLREWDETHLTTEYCGYQCRLTREDCLALLMETALDDAAGDSSTHGRSLSHLAELDPIAALAVDEDIGATNDIVSLLEDLDGNVLPVAVAATAAVGHKFKRTTSRRRRPSISSDTSLLSPLSPPGHRTFSGTAPGPLAVVPCEVELIGGPAARTRDGRSMVSLSVAEREVLRSSIAMKEAKVRLLSSLDLDTGDGCTGQDESLGAYRHKCHEYELLATIYKVLSQPDEVLLKKIADLEDYEERMRKLGTRLKDALTPEDLLKTLASIKPPAPPSDRV